MLEATQNDLLRLVTQADIEDTAASTQECIQYFTTHTLRHKLVCELEVVSYLRRLANLAEPSSRQQLTSERDDLVVVLLLIHGTAGLCTVGCMPEDASKSTPEPMMQDSVRSNMRS